MAFGVFTKMNMKTNTRALLRPHQKKKSPADVATGSQPEIDEERRLLYVAMTRARERLHLLLPQRFYVTRQRGHGDRHLYAGRSRFIPPALDPLFDPVAPEPGANDETDVIPAPAVDLAQRLRRSGGLPDF